MMDALIKKSFQLSTLFVAMSCATASLYAFEDLEKLDDYELGEATGEGIAILPEGFSMRMNGADTANGGDGTYDTGYLRLIPVGPIAGKNTAGNDITYTVAGGDVRDSNGQVIRKADIYLYGLNISQSPTAYGGLADTSLNFGRPIDTWGTGSNPWIIRAETKNVQQFNDTSAGRPVTYFSMEAPLYKTLTVGQNYNDVAALSDAEKSAYNLRLSLWSDAFMRDANVAEGTTKATAYNGLSNQLRINTVWDGFSVNGSNLKLFRTLDFTGSIPTIPNYPTDTALVGLNNAYRQTLGLAGVFRLNSGPTHNYRATTSSTQTAVWQNYNPTSIVYRDYAFTDAEVAQLEAGTHANQNSVIIATGAGDVGSGKVMWNGRVATTGSTSASVNPDTLAANTSTDTAATNGLITSYLPLGTRPARGNLAADNAYDPVSQRNWLVFRDAGYCNQASSVTGNKGSVQNPEHCIHREAFRVISAKATTTTSWSLPDAYKRSVLRIDAAPLSTLSTPALDAPVTSSIASSFDSNKGLFLYGLNANIVLGSLYQPLILDAKDSNFTIEVTRIPNDVDVYSKIYTRYDFDTTGSVPGGGAAPDSTISYLGSTCNIYRCSGPNNGSAININLGNSGSYQTSSATHSSLSIGSTEYDPNLNLLKAHKSNAAFGVSFGALTSATGMVSTGQRDYVQTFDSQRCVNGNGLTAAANACSAGAWSTATDKTWRQWNKTTGTTYTQNMNYQILGLKTGCINNCGAQGVGHAIPSGIPTDLTSSRTVPNNFGSAVIDGMLIQHLKIKTTGLN